MIGEVFLDALLDSLIVLAFLLPINVIVAVFESGLAGSSAGGLVSLYNLCIRILLEESVVLFDSLYKIFHGKKY